MFSPLFGLVLVLLVLVLVLVCLQVRYGPLDQSTGVLLYINNMKLTNMPLEVLFYPMTRDINIILKVPKLTIEDEMCIQGNYLNVCLMGTCPQMVH